MKKSLAIFLSVSMILCLFSSCAKTVPDSSDKSEGTVTPASDGEKIIIGISFSGLASSEFDIAIKDAIYALYDSEGLDSVAELLFSDSDGDADVQISQIDNMIAQGADVIIMNPKDADAAAVSTKKCHELGIPIIELCNESSAPDLRTTYVGSEDIVSGRMLAEALCEAAGGEGKMVILHGRVGQTPELRRHEGLFEVLAEKYPDIEVVAEKVCTWRRDEAMDTVENWIQSGLDFNIIFAENDEMAIGAVLAIQAADKEGAFVVGGIDAVPEALEMVASEELDITIFQDAVGQGETALRVAIELGQGKTVDSFYSIPYKTVTKENVSEFMS